MEESAGSDAASRVFCVPELENLILENLTLKTLFRTQRVCRTFFNFTQASIREWHTEFTRSNTMTVSKDQRDSHKLNPLLSWARQGTMHTKGSFRIGDIGGTSPNLFGKEGVWSEIFLTKPPCTEVWVHVRYSTHPKQNRSSMEE